MSFLRLIYCFLISSVIGVFCRHIDLLKSKSDSSEDK